MSEKTQTEMITELYDHFIPKKREVPELVSFDDIAEMYGKSSYWFPNLKSKHTFYTFEQIKVPGTRKVHFKSEEVLRILKGLGYEPK